MGKKVNLGKVFSKNLARECGVTNFPTIMLFPAGDKSNQNSFENYDGEFTTNSIVSWALEKYNGLTSVQQALRKGGNPNFIHPKFGWTVVHHAAKKGYTEVIKVLLSSNITNP